MILKLIFIKKDWDCNLSFNKWHNFVIIDKVMVCLAHIWFMEFNAWHHLMVTVLLFRLVEKHLTLYRFLMTSTTLIIIYVSLNLRTTWCRLGFKAYKIKDYYLYLRLIFNITVECMKGINIINIESKKAFTKIVYIFNCITQMMGWL